MEQCFRCGVEKHEDDFYVYSVRNVTTRGREVDFSRYRVKHVTRNGVRTETTFTCKPCSDRHYGEKWYPITGYDQKCEISNRGHVKELREGKYFDITHIQNAGTWYVYLSKDGKNMKKNIRGLMKRFVWKDK